jgi:hypothetical protein
MIIKHNRHWIDDSRYIPNSKKTVGGWKSVQKPDVGWWVCLR